MVGEIHLAKVFFTDASAAKIRPVLVLKPNSFGDLIYLPLTSNLQTKGIQIDNSALQEGFLPKSSVVVYEKPAVIASSLLVKKIGRLNKTIYTDIINELILFLQK
jgi:mRNA-degrading endonuclease toxin of MazEF toxin-antitoxin module